MAANIVQPAIFYAGLPILGSRVAMLRGRTVAKCGSCGRYWGKLITNGKRGYKKEKENIFA